MIKLLTPNNLKKYTLYEIKKKDILQCFQYKGSFSLMVNAVSYAGYGLLWLFDRFYNVTQWNISCFVGVSQFKDAFFICSRYFLKLHKLTGLYLGPACIIDRRLL